jgi:hypothetical protein
MDSIARERLIFMRMSASLVLVFARRVDGLARIDGTGVSPIHTRDLRISRRADQLARLRDKKSWVEAFLAHEIS